VLSMLSQLDREPTVEEIYAAAVVNPSRGPWLKLRTQYVTASQTAALFKEHKYLSNNKLLLRKLGAEDPIVENPSMWWGSRLEETNAEAFVDLTGGLPLVDQLWLTRGKLGATLDGLWDCVYDGWHPDWIQWRTERPASGKLCVLEMKNTRDHWDELPRHYWWQVQTQMHVSRLTTGVLVAKVGAAEMDAYKIDYDPFAMAAASDLAEDFMREVSEVTV